MADYLIDPQFRDARNVLATCLGFAIGMALVAYALPLSSLQVARGVSVISGGIDSVEAAEIMRASRNYSLEVEFLPKDEDGRDSYASANPVTIRDAGGHAVFAGLAQGPYLLAALPSGSYTVEARDGERTVRRDVRIQRSRQEHLVFGG